MTHPERSDSTPETTDTKSVSKKSKSLPDRRSFLAGTVASSTLATMAVHTETSHADDQSLGDAVRIALVGCGGRGGGAIGDTMKINDNVALVALADLDEEQAGVMRRGMKRQFEDRIKVQDKDVYSGLDAYKHVLDHPDVDLVLFATPPGFRPQHILDAVEAGKHVFAEKPTCIDPHGYRVCLEAHKKAEEQKTAIVTGTQYRRQSNFVEAIKRLHEGAIGDIISATSRYCSNGIWYKARRDGMSDTEYQIFNWMHFIWLSGDQIAEQAVHNIDVMNWIMEGPPESAYASGGRFTRPDDSEMWDSMSVDYQYPDDRLISFTCRQIPNTKSSNGTVVYGSQGKALIPAFSATAYLWDRDGKELWSMKGDLSAAYRQEHKELVASIRSGTPIVELQQTAESSLTAVMGRMAAYTGQEVTWDFVTQESKLNLFPDKIDLSAARDSGFAVPGGQELI
ncbi:MAG: Gfo/Idh/MocA family oxidoreductase [Planctomycetota bacterium]